MAPHKSKIMSLEDKYFSKNGCHSCPDLFYCKHLLAEYKFKVEDDREKEQREAKGAKKVVR
jgi:hypothetical protein